MLRHFFFLGKHPNWEDRIIISQDGTFKSALRRKQGTWSVSGRTLKLTWADHSSDFLNTYDAGLNFSTPNKFTLCCDPDRKWSLPAWWRAQFQAKEQLVQISPHDLSIGNQGAIVSQVATDALERRYARSNVLAETRSTSSTTVSGDSFLDSPLDDDEQQSPALKPLHRHFKFTGRHPDWGWDDEVIIYENGRFETLCSDENGSWEGSWSISGESISGLADKSWLTLQWDDWEAESLTSQNGGLSFSARNNAFLLTCKSPPSWWRAKIQASFDAVDAAKSVGNYVVAVSQLSRADSDRSAAHDTLSYEEKQPLAVRPSTRYFKFSGTHPDWNDKIIIYENGRFESLGWDSAGSWSLSDERWLTLDWDKFDEESLITVNNGITFVSPYDLTLECTSPPDWWRSQFLRKQTLLDAARARATEQSVFDWDVLEETEETASNATSCVGSICDMDLVVEAEEAASNIPSCVGSISDRGMVSNTATGCPSSCHKTANHAENVNNEVGAVSQAAKGDDEQSEAVFDSDLLQEIEETASNAPSSVDSICSMEETEDAASKIHSSVAIICNTGMVSNTDISCPSSHRKKPAAGRELFTKLLQRRLQTDAEGEIYESRPASSHADVPISGPAEE